MDTPSLQQLLDAIKAEIAAGNKIEAIKLYRDATGAGLAEAKEAVELIAAGKPPQAAESRTPDAAAMDLVREWISAGNIIEAIKIYREATGLGLKESKDAVDRMAMELDPQAFQARAGAMRRLRRTALTAVLVIVGLAVLAFLLSRT